MQQQQQQPATPPPATSQSQPATQSQSQSAQPAAAPGAQQSPAQPKFNPQQVTPVVQIAAPRRADEVGVEDVLLGSIAMIGVLIAVFLIVGLLTGGIFIAIQRWRDKNNPDSTEPQATRLNLS